MSEKVNCLKCKSSMDKKPGLWICDKCWDSGSMRINTVGEQIAAVAKEGVDKILKEGISPPDTESQEDLFKERFLARRGLDKNGIPFKSEMVDHPDHYNQGSIEVIDVIEDWDLDFRLGNAVKYIARAGKKNNEVKQDLEKAIWYIKRYINKES